MKDESCSHEASKWCVGLIGISETFLRDNMLHDGEDERGWP